MTKSAFITTNDVARKLDPPVTPERVRQLRREGKLRPVFVLPNGTCLFTEEEVERYNSERRRHGSAA